MKDKLYAAASDYAQLSLCDTLEKNELFAVRFENELLYCSALRHEAGIALMICPGESALGLLCRRLASRRELKITDLTELDCIVVSVGPRNMLREDDIAQINKLGINYKGKNVWPLFRRMRPGKYPWFVTEEKEERMILCALEAAIFLSRLIDRSTQLSVFAMEEEHNVQSKESIGFSDILSPDAKMPLLTIEEGGCSIEVISARLPENELEIPKFESFSGCKAALIRLPSLIVGEPPFLPYTLVLIDENDKANALVPCAEKAELAAQFRRLFPNLQQPIMICSEETMAFFKEFSLAEHIEKVFGLYEPCEKLLSRLYNHFALSEDRAAESSSERFHRLKRSMRRGGIESICTELCDQIKEFNEGDAVFYGAESRELARIASVLLLEGRTRLGKDELAHTLENYYLCPKTLCLVLAILSDEAFEVLLRCIEAPVSIEECSEEACLSLCYLYLVQIENTMMSVKQRLCNAIRLVPKDECMRMRSRRSLVERYILAGVNLFGAIEKKKLIEIFDQSEDTRLTPNELEAIISPAIYGLPGCGYNADVEHVFSNEYAPGGDPLFYLFKLQRSHSYRLPKGDFSAYAEPSCYEPCGEMDELAKLCEKIWFDEAKTALGIFHIALRSGLCNYEALENIRTRFGSTLKEGSVYYDEFCVLYDKALACVGRWKLRGNIQGASK